MRVGLLGNSKNFFNGEALNHAKKAKIVKKKEISPVIVKKSHKKGVLNKSFCHKKSVWFYNVKNENLTPVFTSLDRNFDFGVITEEKLVKFYIRNADDKSIYLQDIKNEVNGVRISGINAGDTLKQNEWRKVILTVQNAGDIDAKGEIKFIFENQTIILKISGTRAVIFAYRPNFSYSQTKEFKTDIFTAQNGKETRVAKLNRPKISVSFSITTKEIENGVIDVLNFALNKYCLIPLWLSLTLCTEDSKGEILKCDTRDFDKYLIIWRDFNDYNFAKILKLGEESITIDKKIEAKKGDFILPVIKATPNKRVNYDFLNSEIKSFNLEFKELL